MDTPSSRSDVMSFSKASASGAISEAECTNVRRRLHS
jgi:hypothetical protein